MQPKPEIFYWRTAGGAEVDFVTERGPKLLPLEVKTARQITLHELRHLDIFLTDSPTRAAWGAVLHHTDRAQLLTRTIASLPIAAFL